MIRAEYFVKLLVLPIYESTQYYVAYCHLYYLETAVEFPTRLALFLMERLLLNGHWTTVIGL